MNSPTSAVGACSQAITALLSLIAFSAASLRAVVPDPPPRYFAAQPGALVATKARLAAGDTSLQPALDKLIADADAALTFTPVSVTHKTKLAPSGDRHDYMSTGPYWWPDPSKPDGLPYLQRDGRVNPESRTAASDQARLETLGNTVEPLALAFWFTSQPAYAEHAARCLRVWFLDDATKMNPHFEFAQGVPGRNTGRGIGLIEAGGLVAAIDAAALLAGSPAWPARDHAALHAWGDAFLDWMLTSQHGRDEAAARNNHGTMFDVRAARLALVLGRTDLARAIIETAKTRRIALQIAPEGSQPHELARTKSFSYSRLNLGGLVTLAALGEHIGVDLWEFSTPDGRSLRKAIDFMAPYIATPPQPWPHAQIAGLDPASFASIFRQAAVAYRDPRFAAIVAAVPGTHRARFQLLHPLP